MNPSEPPQSYTLVPSPTARSKLIATRSIRKGTLLLATPRPTSHVLVDATKGVRCDECMRLLDEVGTKLRCAGCREDVYCSTPCQKTAWTRHHRILCSKLPSLSQKLGQVQLPEADRLDAFLLARLAVEYFLLDPKLSEPDLEPNPNSAASTFLSLLSIEPDPSQRPSPIPAILNALLPLLSTPFLASLIARFQRNNHVLLSNDAILHPFAHVVLADVSRSVNHSCVPTALVSHKFGREVGVRTIRDLEEGDEITISYLDPILSISTRKKTLAHTYSFECICALCTSPPVNPFRPSHIPRPSLSPSSVQPSYPPIPTPTRPLPLSEKQITNLTVGFEEAHKDERWEQASSQGEKVLMVYWGAYGGYASPIIGTHMLSLAQISLNRAILLPGGDPTGKQFVARAEMFVSWARTVLEVVWGRGEDVEVACSDLEGRVAAEKGSAGYMT